MDSELTDMCGTVPQPGSREPTVTGQSDQGGVSDHVTAAAMKRILSATAALLVCSAAAAPAWHMIDSDVATIDTGARAPGATRRVG